MLPARSLLCSAPLPRCSYFPFWRYRSSVPDSQGRSFPGEPPQLCPIIQNGFILHAPVGCALPARCLHRRHTSPSLPALQAFLIWPDIASVVTPCVSAVLSCRQPWLQQRHQDRHCAVLGPGSVGCSEGVLVCIDVALESTTKLRPCRPAPPRHASPAAPPLHALCHPPQHHYLQLAASTHTSTYT